ncbi:MAG: endonuclease domain-containing protein [Oscillospiraceae bacterium]|nr:endonuclease domain-containing protein [Oscillospiraceae bacterium]
MIEYNKNNIPAARSLRKNMTPWEKKLWYQFLRKYPVRFQRQKAIGEYIADFYCAKAKLVVEIDGKEHFEKEAYTRDLVRTKELEKFGLKIIRISNFDIHNKFEDVCLYIDSEVKNLSLSQLR